MQRSVPRDPVVGIRVTTQTFLLRIAVRCILYQLLTEPNIVNLGNVTVDMSVVSFEIRSTLKCRYFHSFTGMWCCVVCSIL